MLKAEMSEDQVWGLYLGFSLVKKLVDSQNTHFFIENEGQNDMLTLVEAVQEMTLRTMRIMHAAHILQYPDHNAWRIKNDVTGNTVSRGGDFADFLPHAYLFRLSQEWITDAIPMSLAYAIAFDYVDLLGVTYVPWPDPTGWSEHY